MLRTTMRTLTAFAVGALAQFNLDESSNAIGICYSVWHDLAYDGSQPPDIVEITEVGNGNFAGQGAWHWWGRPEGSYYGGGDRAVLDRHFHQLSGAGVDFIAIDATNLVGYDNYAPGLFTEPSDVLLDEAVARREAGEPTPHVVFWVKSGASDPDPGAVGRFVRDRYYSNPTYAPLWVTLEGRPLLLTTDTLPSELAGDFTLRKMWGLQDTLAEREWSFLQDAPQNVAMNSGQPEQISVCAAKQADYMTNLDTATPRRGGLTFQEQWRTAFDIKPKVVMLTWWNEWTAQRQADGPHGPQFVDNYNSEYSRDIEPQDATQPTSNGGKYLDWMAQYISAYRSGQPMPEGLAS